MKNAKSYGPYYQALTCGFQKGRKVTEEIAQKYELKMVNLPGNAIDRSMFVDFCHVNSEGEKVKARYVAEALMPIIEKLTPTAGIKK